LELDLADVKTAKIARQLGVSERTIFGARASYGRQVLALGGTESAVS